MSRHHRHTSTNFADGNCLGHSRRYVRRIAQVILTLAALVVAGSRPGHAQQVHPACGTHVEYDAHFGAVTIVLQPCEYASLRLFSNPDSATVVVEGNGAVIRGGNGRNNFVTGASHTIRDLTIRGGTDAGLWVVGDIVFERVTIMGNGSPDSIGGGWSCRRGSSVRT